MTTAPPLVLVGDLEGETYLSAATSVRERIAAHGLGAQVILPGFVSDEALACLYSGRNRSRDPLARRGLRAAGGRGGDMRRTGRPQRPAGTP